jgi:hypothetical protein
LSEAIILLDWDAAFRKGDSLSMEGLKKSEGFYYTLKLSVISMF